MAENLLLYLPGHTVDTSRFLPHRKCTLASPATRLTFPYVDADSNLDDLARTWVEQDRPTKKPLTRPGPLKLTRHSLTGVFADPEDNQISVEWPLTILRSLAARDEPLVLTYGPLSSDTRFTESGRWVIRGLAVNITHRRASDNAATRAVATIDLLEANVPGWTPLPAQSDQGAVVVAGAGLGRQRTYTVAAGEHLYTIAAALYGDASRWIFLADANGITNPTAVPPGTVLVVP